MGRLERKGGLLGGPYVSLRQIAEELGVSRQSARRYLDQASIRPIMLGSGRNGAIRYALEEVKSWLNARRA